MKIITDIINFFSLGSLKDTAMFYAMYLDPARLSNTIDGWNRLTRFRAETLASLKGDDPQ